MSLRTLLPVLGLMASVWNLSPFVAPANAEPTSNGVVISSNRTTYFTFAPNFPGKKHNWGGWTNQAEGTLGSFGFKADATLYRDVASFDLSQLPTGKPIVGATLRFTVATKMTGTCPVVPLLTVAKLPPEKDFDRWPESVWGAMDNSNNELVSIPMQAQPEHVVPLAQDAKLVKYVQAALKGKKPRVLVLGFKSATERCALYTFHHPVELELAFGK